jgi:regulator of sigma E protease
MGAIIGTILTFLIVFGILVFIHEFGHFAMAKFVGVRVETFSFGFGKRLLGFKKGATDYRISLVPLGGYVKFLGEEAFEPGAALAPDNFMAKSRWKRFLIIVMGALMNVLLAIVIFTIVNMAGVTVPEYLNEKPVIGWIDAGSPAEKADLKIDDEILRINGRTVATWNDVEMAIGTRPEKVLTIDIRRDGGEMPVTLMTGLDKKYKFDLGYAGFYGKILTQVQLVNSGSAAEKGGLKPGDVVQTINGEPVYFYKFVQVLEKNPGKELEIGVLRDGKPLALHVTPRREGQVGKIGVLQVMKSVEKTYGFFGALNQSLKDCASMALTLIDLIKKLFTGQASASKNLGGPLEIASMSYSFFQLGFMKLLWFMGFISLQLGVINLLPIPVLPLDGTQIFILGVEGIRRRDLSPKLKQIWTQVMFIVFMALFAFLVVNDIVRRLPRGWKSLLPFLK